MNVTINLTQALVGKLSFEDGLLSVGGWLSVQAGRYRFMAVGSGSIIIRGVLSEYLGFEVIWA